MMKVRNMVKHLTERKRSIKEIYDGYVYQLYHNVVENDENRGKEV